MGLSHAVVGMLHCPIRVLCRAIGQRDELPARRPPVTVRSPKRARLSGGIGRGTARTSECIRQPRWAMAWIWIVWPEKGCKGSGTVLITGDGSALKKRASAAITSQSSRSAV